MDVYDLIVIGSGAGLSIIDAGLRRGLKCALIENTKIGATCLTRGCIPSKVLVYPADIIREANHVKTIGVNLQFKGIDWDLISKRVWSQINEEKEMQKGLLEIKNLDLFMGNAEFMENYELKVILNKDNKVISPLKGNKIVIASGGRALIPPIKGLKDVGYITSESFFGEKYPKKPWKSLILIGGGIIAAEFAHIFSAFGTEVTIVEMLPRLVSTEEPEISSIVEHIFKKNMNVYLNQKAIEVKPNNDNKKVILEDINTKERTEIEAEEIFIATGRRSNTDILKIENTNIELDKKGWIITNEFLETTVNNIWCIGDANGLYPFRHKANLEARICINNMFGEQKQIMDYTSVPWAVFTYPQIAHVGITEAEAIEKGYKIYIAKNRYSSVAKGFAMGYNEGDENDGFVKLIVDQSYRILGVHIVGPEAAILVQPFVYLMNSGFTCSSIENNIEEGKILPKTAYTCPEGGSFLPIYNSMIIHPSLNEVTGWVIGNLTPVNIEIKHHHH